MFQLNIVLFLLVTIYLSNGQNISGKFVRGTCNVSSYYSYAYSEEGVVSCDITTCLESLNDTENCSSIERIWTFEDLQQSQSTKIRQSQCEISPYILTVFSYDRPSVYQMRCSNSQQQICLSTSDSYDFSFNKDLIRLIWIGFGLVLLFLPIIIFFNCNLASGPNHSFVFFYQCAPLASVSGMYVAFLVMQNFILANDLRHIMFEYCKYIIIIFIIFLVPFLVKCTSCPLQMCLLPWAKVRRAVRNFREKHIGSTFIHAICSIIVLSYGDLVAISVRVLIVSSKVIAFDPCCFSGYAYYYLGPRPPPCDVPHTIRNEYLAYLITSVVVLALLLPLPLSLIYYPSIPALFHKLTGRSLPRFPKLDPVFDVFQGVYKDKMRWFAGVHLLYLMILWTVYLVLQDGLPFFFVIILAIHSLFQPFKNAKHNYLETLYLVYLVVISFGNMYVQNIYSFCTASSTELCDEKRNMIRRVVVIVFSVILLALPTFLVFVFCCHKILSKRVCCQRFIAKIKSCHKVEHMELKNIHQEEEQEEEPHYYVAEWS